MIAAVNNNGTARLLYKRFERTDEEVVEAAQKCMKKLRAQQKAEGPNG